MNFLHKNKTVKPHKTSLTVFLFIFKKYVFHYKFHFVVDLWVLEQKSRIFVF